MNKYLDITIAPTMRCNFNCSYCFEGDNKSFSKMSAEVENAIIQYIVKKKQSTERLILRWFGGEPLLAFDKILSISSRLDTAKSRISCKYNNKWKSSERRHN